MRRICIFRGRRRNPFLLTAITVLTAGVVLSASLAIRGAILAAHNPSIQPGNTIIIDAGHGGVDPGAIGVNGVDEKEINLQIALCLRDILTANGYEVVMIRDEDVSIHDPKYTKISQIKTSDLKKRLKIIEKYPDALAVSIHQNHFQKEQYHGAQMFYGRVNPESKALAQSIQNAFRQNLQPDNERQIKKSTSDVYIVNNAKNPIVLVECGFLSNWEECEKLCDEEYQRQAAFTIFCGISAYRQGDIAQEDTAPSAVSVPQEDQSVQAPVPPGKDGAAEEPAAETSVEVWFVRE